MATYQELTVYEANDETLSLALTSPDDGTAYDLTGAGLELVLKTSVDELDSDPDTVIISTDTGGIVIDDATGGLATVTVQRGELQIPGDLVWRLDVVRSGTRRTAVYGSLHVVNL